MKRTPPLRWLSGRGTERFPVQLKLDTGMTSLGGEWQEGAQLVAVHPAALPQLDLVWPLQPSRLRR